MVNIFNYLQPPELSGDIFLSFDYSREQSCYFSFQKDFEFKKCHTHTKILHIVPVYLVLEKEISEAIFCMRMRDRQRFHNVEKNNKSIYNLPDFAIKWCIKQIYFVKILFNKHIDDF